MRCDDLNRWLDEGAPESDAAAARAHAAGCAACARSLGAFDALERALAAPAPPPPNAAYFTARVMERLAGAVRTVSAAERPVTVPARTSWWVALLSEPAFAVAIVAAFLLATTPAAVQLAAGRSLALPLTVASETLGGQFSQAIHAWLGPITFTEQLSPLARLYVFIGIAPLFVWAGVWMWGAAERFFRGVLARRG